MKSVLRVLGILLCMTSFLFATMDEDGVLLIDMAGDAPIIDGLLDGVWKNTTDNRQLKVESAVVDSILSAPLADQFSSFHAMWDEDNFYLFITVIDDSISTLSANDWDDDCHELYFDGDNSKNDLATGYDDNDKQWRYVYGTTPTGDPPGDFVFLETDVGWNFEIAIPQADLTFTLEEGAMIGLEVQTGDNDGQLDTRDRTIRWWTNDPFAWNTPASFGTAELVGREVTEVMDINYTEEEPAVDGLKEDGEGYEEMPEFTENVWEEGTDENDSLGVNLDYQTTWSDFQFSFWYMWNEDYLHLFIEVMDDSISTIAANDWDDDCVELYFDGDNSKNDQATGYDTNDHQYRYVYGTAPAGDPPGDFAFLETETGWNFEIAFAAADLDFTLEEGAEIGVEVQCGDNDGTTDRRECTQRWWTSDPYAWNTPASFGTAELVKGGVGVENPTVKPRDFNLAQNYPNPFNPQTYIDYEVKVKSHMRLLVYDLLGREVAVLVNEVKGPGTHRVTFDAAELNSGIYFYKLESNDKVMTRKMTLIR